MSKTGQTPYFAMCNLCLYCLLNLVYPNTVFALNIPTNMSEQTLDPSFKLVPLKAVGSEYALFANWPAVYTLTR